MSNIKRLYYVSQDDSSVFTMWDNERIAVTFDSPGDGTIAETNPKLLARILFKDDETRNEIAKCLFETAEDAARAYIKKVLYWNEDSIKTDAEKLDLKHRIIEGLKTIGRPKNGAVRKVYFIDLPLADSAPELESLEAECCANCACDFYTEDDGYERHECPFVKKAKGLATTKCSLYAKSVPAIPVQVDLSKEEEVQT